MRRFAWLCVCLLFSALLILASCGQGGTTTPATTVPVATTTSETTTTKPASTTVAVEKPKYGGTLSITVAPAITVWDPTRQITGIFSLYLNSLWEGDWTKGPAGGYGTKETDWGFGNNDIFDLKAGRIAESWKWSVDADKKEGTIVYQIRPGSALGARSEQRSQPPRRRP